MSTTVTETISGEKEITKRSFRIELNAPFGVEYSLKLFREEVVSFDGEIISKEYKGTLTKKLSEAISEGREYTLADGKVLTVEQFAELASLVSDDIAASFEG